MKEIQFKVYAMKEGSQTYFRLSSGEILDFNRLLVKAWRQVYPVSDLISDKKVRVKYEYLDHEPGRSGFVLKRCNPAKDPVVGKMRITFEIL